MIQPMAQRIPRLENGDRLSRDEFERRSQAMPQLKKAELIEGVVHMPSSVSQRDHSGPHFRLNTWLGFYAAHTPGVEGGDNGSIRLDLDNEPQPDGFLRYQAGGRSTISADGYVEGAPELVAEVAASRVSIDLGPKLNAYRRNGIQEYVVWRVLDEAIDWFELRSGQYEPLPLSPEGWYKSNVFPGLWLDPAALIRGDQLEVLRVTQRGIASAEHAAFVARWKQAH